MLSKKKKNIPKVTYFGANLKFLRKLNGLTQTQLANSLGATRSNIASYESGIVEPKARIFILACNYFNVAPRTMLGIILSNQPIVDTAKGADSINPVDKFVLDQFDEFVIQTNNHSKILEGYKAYKLFYPTSDTDKLSDFNHIFKDVLSLSNSLVKLNWELIHSMIPSEAEEE